MALSLGGPELEGPKGGLHDAKLSGARKPDGLRSRPAVGEWKRFSQFCNRSCHSRPQIEGFAWSNRKISLCLSVGYTSLPGASRPDALATKVRGREWVIAPEAAGVSQAQRSL